jgi:hypothetical protein
MLLVDRHRSRTPSEEEIMDANRDNTSAPESTIEKAAATPEPLFRRYQIKVRTDLRLGALPLGRPPIF